MEIDIPEMIRKTASKVTDNKGVDQKWDLGSLLKTEGVKRYDRIGKYTILSHSKQTLFKRCTEFISMLFESLQTMFG